jgi:DNA modification methylase
VTGKLFYGDNLDVLRNEVGTGTVDLVYLDPPFNSQATYNVLFKTPGGQQSQAQLEAFEDTWTWSEQSERALNDILKQGTGVADALLALRKLLGNSDTMAYLAMMAVRLVELHRVLKPQGTLYLHCDPKASHYLKVLMDGIFSAGCYINEISWRRTTAKADHAQGATHFPRLRDVILRYSRDVSVKPVYNQLFTSYGDEYLETKYRYADSDGRRYRLDNLTGPGGAAKGNPSYDVMGVTRHWRYSKKRMEELTSVGMIVQTKPGMVPQLKRYLDKMPGVPLGDDWDDIRPINSQALERLGYPTQKPLALLERIIQTSSNEGDLILDPFCGCGTAIHAAQKLGRDWIGIDVTHLAVGLIERRMRDAFPSATFKVFGTPEDLDGARDLAERDKYQFQWWAVTLVEAIPFNSKKKGADQGIDGIRYMAMGKDKTERAIVSVKGGGNVSVQMIRDLRGVIEREEAPAGIFLSLVPPTEPMAKEATKAGLFDSPWGTHPRIQIFTVEQLLKGQKPNLPPREIGVGFKAITKEIKAVQQASLL